jgi:hypothetical protein
MTTHNLNDALTNYDAHSTLSYVDPIARAAARRDAIAAINNASADDLARARRVFRYEPAIIALLEEVL